MDFEPVRISDPDMSSTDGGCSSERERQFFLRDKKRQLVGRASKHSGHFAINRAGVA